MVNNSTNINKTNRLSLQIIEHTKGLGQAQICGGY